MTPDSCSDVEATRVNDLNHLTRAKVRREVEWIKRESDPLIRRIMPSGGVKSSYSTRGKEQEREKEKERRKEDGIS